MQPPSQLLCAQVASTSCPTCQPASQPPAAGKAGGFLALDWNDGSPVGPLARKSYALHKELAQEFGAEAVGYRAVSTLSVAAAAKASAGAARGQQPPSWVDGNVLSCSVSGVLFMSNSTVTVTPPVAYDWCWQSMQAVPLRPAAF